MRNLIMAVLLVLFSINSIASATEDDVFVIETEGNFRIQECFIHTAPLKSTFEAPTGEGGHPNPMGASPL